MADKVDQIAWVAKALGCEQTALWLPDGRTFATCLDAYAVGRVGVRRSNAFLIIRK